MTYIALALEEEIVDEHAIPVEETHEETTQEESVIGNLTGQFGVNVPSFLGQLLNFFIVFLILMAFVYRPILKLLNEREEKIAKSVKQADEIEQRLSAVEQEQNDILKEAKKSAMTIADNATKSGEERHEEIVAAAKREVERIITKGKAQLAEEKANMLREMRKDIVNIAMKAATRVAQDAVDEKRSKSLSEEIVRKMTKS